MYLFFKEWKEHSQERRMPGLDRCVGVKENDLEKAKALKYNCSKKENKKWNHAFDITTLHLQRYTSPLVCTKANTFALG